jgi:hypothetical protein
MGGLEISDSKLRLNLGVEGGWKLAKRIEMCVSSQPLSQSGFLQRNFFSCAESRLGQPLHLTHGKCGWSRAFSLIQSFSHHLCSSSRHHLFQELALKPKDNKPSKKRELFKNNKRTKLA